MRRIWFVCPTVAVSCAVYLHECIATKRIIWTRVRDLPLTICHTGPNGFLRTDICPRENPTARLHGLLKQQKGRGRGEGSSLSVSHPSLWSRSLIVWILFNTITMKILESSATTSASRQRGKRWEVPNGIRSTNVLPVAGLAHHRVSRWISDPSRFFYHRRSPHVTTPAHPNTVSSMFTIAWSIVDTMRV